MNVTILNPDLWKPIPGYYPYEAHPMGYIRNGITLKPIKIDTQIFKNKDYQIVMLSINKKRFRRSVHRLVAMTFLPKPFGGYDKYDVDHIDFNPRNNVVFNLRWLPKDVNNRNKRNANPVKFKKWLKEHYGVENVNDIVVVPE